MIFENSLPKGIFGKIKQKTKFPSCRGILDISGQELLRTLPLLGLLKLRYFSLSFQTLLPAKDLTSIPFFRLGVVKQNQHAIACAKIVRGVKTLPTDACSLYTASDFRAHSRNPFSRLSLSRMLDCSQFSFGEITCSKVSHLGLPFV